ncbi:thiamine phosphate synthase [Arenibacter sp. 6A1]|uniref:thiamine phosphate synthase n=1 Tax=Arenibacter sp. 6A1 TaxID=2720391 RepID=UPI001445C078|nr:thiamine phosphate synthase [Arenibacter sp. 6A1]NKI25129.1 thiamine phosphate synthase [Arenibacter sp. 6A1]
MILLIASEKDLENETAHLNQLFKAGLASYHFRKPAKSLEECRRFLDLIDSEYHARIVTHGFHALAEEYTLKGVHLKEQLRTDLKEGLLPYVQNYRDKGFTVSSSFHEPEALSDCKIPFDYCLLSPVFTSISKQGYQGKGFNIGHVPKKIIGLGGIREETIAQTVALGYSGIGVLGAIWQSKEPIKSFIRIQQAYRACIK